MHPQSLKPKALNRKSQNRTTLNPRPETLNPKSQNRRTLNPRPETLNPLSTALGQDPALDPEAPWEAAVDV